MNHEAADKTDIIDQITSILDQAAIPEKGAMVRQIAEWSQHILNSPAVELNGLGAHHDSRELPTVQPARLQPAIDQTVVSLIENDTHYRYIAENIDQVFWVMDIRTKRFLYINPSFEVVWGYSAERLYNNPRVTHR